MIHKIINVCNKNLTLVVLAAVLFLAVGLPMAASIISGLTSNQQQELSE
jgi:flagellar motor switch protein FliG